MRTRVSLVSIAIVVAALSAACGGGPPTLSGARTDIPVFASASLDDEHEATTSDTFAQVEKFRTHSWELTTTASWQEVDAFYSSALPGAERADETTPVPDDEAPLEDEVRYIWVPDGWRQGEQVMVLINKLPGDGKTHFRISQDVLNQ